MPSTLSPLASISLGIVAVVGLVLVEDVPERVPVGGALHAQIESIVGVANLVPILPAGDGIGAGCEHLVDGVEASSKQPGLRTVAVERDAQREHLAGADQARGLDDVLRGDVIEGADLIILAPAAPVGKLLRRLGNRLPAHLDVNSLPHSAVLLRQVPMTVRAETREIASEPDCAPSVLRFESNWKNE